MKVKRRPSGTCPKCGTWRTTLHRDHVVPKFKGGLDEPSNWQYICANCHEDKTREERVGHHQVLKSMGRRGPDRRPRRTVRRPWVTMRHRRARSVLFDPILFAKNPHLLALEEEER